MDSYILENCVYVYICSFRWLKPNRKRLNNFNPCGSKMLKILFFTGTIRDNNVIMKTEIDSEFLVLKSRYWTNHLGHREKNQYLKQSILEL